MELSLPAAQHAGLTRRAAPIGAAAVLVAGAGFLATHDPGAAGARYPACVFHQMTGLWCPGCGLTRGTYQLLHGHVGAALGSNVFTPVAIAAVMVAWFAWLRMALGSPPLQVPHRTIRAAAVLLPMLILAYGVLRNLPVSAVKSLAP